MLAARGPRGCSPFMFGIGNDDRSVVELHFIARPTAHDVGRRNHTCRLAVGAD
jgi:hypothetical protein